MSYPTNNTSNHETKCQSLSFFEKLTVVWDLFLGKMDMEYSRACKMVGLTKNEIYEMMDTIELQASEISFLKAKLSGYKWINEDSDEYGPHEEVKEYGNDEDDQQLYEYTEEKRDEAAHREKTLIKRNRISKPKFASGFYESDDEYEY